MCYFSSSNAWQRLRRRRGRTASAWSSACSERWVIRSRSVWRVCTNSARMKMGCLTLYRVRTMLGHVDFLCSKCCSIEQHLHGNFEKCVLTSKNIIFNVQDILVQCGLWKLTLMKDKNHPVLYKVNIMATLVTTQHHQSNIVQCHYNTVNFLINIHKRHPHSLALKGRYGVSFVDPSSEWDSASVPVIIYIKSYNIGLCNVLDRILFTWSMGFYFWCKLKIVKSEKLQNPVLLKNDSARKNWMKLYDLILPPSDVSLPAVFMPQKSNNMLIFNPRAGRYFHPTGMYVTVREKLTNSS